MCKLYMCVYSVYYCMGMNNCAVDMSFSRALLGHDQPFKDYRDLFHLHPAAYCTTQSYMHGVKTF